MKLLTEARILAEEERGLKGSGGLSRCMGEGMGGEETLMEMRKWLSRREAQRNCNA